MLMGFGDLFSLSLSKENATAQMHFKSLYTSVCVTFSLNVAAGKHATSLRLFHSTGTTQSFSRLP